MFKKVLVVLFLLAGHSVTAKQDREKEIKDCIAYYKTVLTIIGVKEDTKKIQKICERMVQK